MTETSACRNQQRFPWPRPDFGQVTGLRSGGQPQSPFRTETVADEPIWIVTSYGQVKALLADPRLSADPHQAGFPLLGRSLALQQPTPFMRSDPPQHTTFRKTLARHFTMRASHALRPAIEATANDLIDAMLRHPGRQADLVNDFAVPLSMQVILSLIGLPASDWPYLADLATRHMCANPLTERGQLRTSLRTGQALTNYLERAINSRLTTEASTEDILSTLLAAAAAGDIAFEAIVPNVFLLVIAGHDTSAGMIAGTMQTLLEEPTRAETLRARPEQVPSAIEESLRYLSIVHQITLRVAVEDLGVGDIVIRAGQGVALMLYSANHDSTRFAAADEFDPTRPENGHLAFGHGIHKCIGQTLARVELDVGIRLLLRRLPELRLSRSDRLRYKPNSPIQGLLSLPVTL